MRSCVVGSGAAWARRSATVEINPTEPSKIPEISRHADTIREECACGSAMDGSLSS